MIQNFAQFLSARQLVYNQRSNAYHVSKHLYGGLTTQHTFCHRESVVRERDYCKTAKLG